MSSKQLYDLFKQNTSSITLPLQTLQNHSCFLSCKQSIQEEKMISCHHLDCQVSAHLLCSCLHGAMLFETNILQFSCPEHGGDVLPLFCSCQSSLIDDHEQKIKCQRCYELYHVKCIDILPEKEEDFCCKFCDNLPDLTDLQTIHLKKQKQVDAIKRANVVILALQQMEINLCTVIDKINLLAPYLDQLPNLHEAICNDAILAHRFYSSPHYLQALKFSQGDQNSNFYGLAPLLSLWEDQLQPYRTRDIPSDALMEWLCTFPLILTEMAFQLNQNILQSQLFQDLFPKLLFILAEVISNHYQHLSSDLSSKLFFSGGTEISFFDQIGSWIESISQLYPISSSKESSDDLTDDMMIRVILSDDQDCGDPINPIVPFRMNVMNITPNSLESIIKQGQSILHTLEELVSQELPDSLHWFHDLLRYLSKVHDIMEIRWVEINNIYTKIAKLLPFLFNKKQKKFVPIPSNVLHDLIRECEELPLRPEILVQLYDIRDQYTQLNQDIQNNLVNLAPRQMNILDDLLDRIASSPVIVEKKESLESCLDFLKQLNEMIDYYETSTICQVPLNLEAYTQLISGNNHAATQPPTQTRARRKKKSEMSQQDLTLHNKIPFESIVEFLKIPFCPDYYNQECQLYHQNIQFIVSHIQDLIAQDNLQQILNSQEKNLESIVVYLESKREIIEFFIEQLEVQYYSCRLEHELRLLIKSYDILKRHVHLEVSQSEGSASQPSDGNKLSLHDLTLELEFIQEVIDSASSHSSSELMRAISVIFAEKVKTNLVSCQKDYKNLQNIFNFILQGEICSISRCDISKIIHSLQIINNISDEDPGDQKKKKEKNAKSLYASLQIICQFTENIENQLSTLPSYDLRTLRELLKNGQSDLIQIFPAIQVAETTEEVVKIIKSLPFSKAFQDSFTRNYQLEAIETSTVQYSDHILKTMKKLFDTTGKLTLKTPLKEAEKYEIYSLAEMMKSDVASFHQTILDCLEFNSSPSETIFHITIPTLQKAVLAHVQLQWWQLCSESLSSIIQPISLEDALVLQEKWNNALAISTADLIKQYRIDGAYVLSVSPAGEILQMKDFLEKWIHMTIERKEGFKSISTEYQNFLDTFSRKYHEGRELNNEGISTMSLIHEEKEQKKFLFEIILELKLSLHTLQDQLKTDKRITFLPVFHLQDESSLQINAFMTMTNLLSMIPNSIVLLFADEVSRELGRSYAGILSFDKLQKICRLFPKVIQSPADSPNELLNDLKTFFEALLDTATTWSQEAKKMIPVGTRGGLKKSAIQFSISDIKNMLSEPVTRYLEPPGYKELTDILSEITACEKELLTIFIPSSNREDEINRELNDEEDENEEFEKGMVTYIDACRLSERWGALSDRISHLPIQIDRFAPLIRWLYDFFEWIRVIPEQIFDLVHIREPKTNPHLTPFSNKKLNFIEKDKSKVILEVGNNILQNQPGELKEFFLSLNVLLQHDSDGEMNTSNPTFFAFDDKVNPIIRFSGDIYQYFLKCLDETEKYEVTVRGILEKITKNTTPENMEKNIELLKKVISKCDELFILPENSLRIQTRNLLRQLETSLWDGITLFNENNKKAEILPPPVLEETSSMELEHWIPALLNTTSSTSEELLSTATSYFEDEDDEFIVNNSIDDDDEFTPTSSKKRKKSRTPRKSSDSLDTLQKLGNEKGAIREKKPPQIQVSPRSAPLPPPEEIPQNCIVEGCEWLRMKNSNYCSESCAIKSTESLFDALLASRPAYLFNQMRHIPDVIPKMNAVVASLDQGNLIQENLVNDLKVVGSRTNDIMVSNLSQSALDFLFPPLPALGTFLTTGLRKQVRTELQNAILAGLTRLNIPCAFACAVTISTDIEKCMAQQVTNEETLRVYRKKYLLYSKAFKDPYNDTKIQKILENEMTIEDLLKLESTDFDDDEKQQRRLESINAEKKKLVPAGKSLTELLEEKRRAAEEGVEAWRDGTALDQTTKSISVNLPISTGKSLPVPSDPPPKPPKEPKEPQPEAKVEKISVKPTIKQEQSKSVSVKQEQTPQIQSKPLKPPKQIAPNISLLLEPIAKRAKVESSESIPDLNPVKSENSPQSNLTDSFQYFTEVHVSTPLGPAQAHLPQSPRPHEEGPLKVLLTNQNDSQFQLHITNYPIMRETVSLVCVGGLTDCTGQGILVSGIQNDKRYQIDAFKKQLRGFKKHVPIAILVCSVKEERQLTEVKYRYICDMFATPEKERIPSAEFHGDQEQVFQLHLIVPQLTKYFPQLNPIVQQSTTLLPHGFWIYGILEMDRDTQGPEELVRCNQVDFPPENIKFLMGKVEKLVNTIESMPQPDVHLAIERVQQTVGNQFDFLNPGHKDFQFFINQVNQRLREKKIKEWSKDSERGKKRVISEVSEDKRAESNRSFSPERDSKNQPSEKKLREHERSKDRDSMLERRGETRAHDRLPSLSRSSSYESSNSRDSSIQREPPLARSWSDELERNFSRNGDDNRRSEESKRKSRFS